MNVKSTTLIKVLGSAQALSYPFYLDGVLINKTPETRLNGNGDFSNSELKNKFHLKIFFLENFIKTIIYKRFEKTVDVER